MMCLRSPTLSIRLLRAHMESPLGHGTRKRPFTSTFKVLLCWFTCPNVSTVTHNSLSFPSALSLSLALSVFLFLFIFLCNTQFLSVTRTTYIDGIPNTLSSQIPTLKWLTTILTQRTQQTETIILFCLSLFLNGPLFLYFRLFNSVDRKQLFNIKLADGWIRTVDLWFWKRPLYQMSHTHCPSISLAFVNNIYARSCLKKAVST